MGGVFLPVLRLSARVLDIFSLRSSFDWLIIGGGLLVYSAMNILVFKLVIGSVEDRFIFHKSWAIGVFFGTCIHGIIIKK